MNIPRCPFCGKSDFKYLTMNGGVRVTACRPCHTKIEGKGVLQVIVWSEEY